MTASAYLAGVWIAAVVAILLIYRLTGFHGKTKDWPQVSVAAFLIVTTVFAAAFYLLAPVLGVRASDLVGAAILGALTFGSASAVGVLSASLLANRKAGTDS